MTPDTAIRILDKLGLAAALCIIFGAAVASIIWVPLMAIAWAYLLVTWYLLYKSRTGREAEPFG